MPESGMIFSSWFRQGSCTCNIRTFHAALDKAVRQKLLHGPALGGSLKLPRGLENQLERLRLGGTSPQIAKGATAGVTRQETPREAVL